MSRGQFEKSEIEKDDFDLETNNIREFFRVLFFVLNPSILIFIQYNNRKLSKLCCKIIQL